MSVKKIFVILITIVACVAIGALVLNILMPNAVTQVVNATENMIYKATGIEFDFNGDGVTGSNAMNPGSAIDNTGDKASDGVGVEGFN